MYYAAIISGFSVILTRATRSVAALLLKGIGANGTANSTFVDSSTNNFTLTKTGNVTQGTFSPFNQNGYSSYLGPNNYLTIPANSAFDVTGGDFSIECWINLEKYNPTVNNGMTIITTMTSFNNGWEIGCVGVNAIDAFKFRTYTVAYGMRELTCTAINSTTFPLDVWNHLAVTREGANNKFFLNGVLMGTYTAYTADPGGQLAVGVYQQNMGYPSWVYGKISNIRIIKGYSVYTSNFTPSDINLTAVAGTSLLILQDKLIIDKSPNNFTITVVGTPRTQNAPFVYYDYKSLGNSGSLYFDGVGDYLLTPSSSAFGLGTGDFTIEAMIYPTVVTTASGVVIIDLRSGSASNAPFITLGTDGSIRFFASNTLRITGSILRAYRWYHVAVVRISGVTKLYLNGVQTGSAYTDTNNYISPANVCIGTNYNGSSTLFYSGYLSSIRIVKGTGVYTTTFPMLTVPVTAIENTSLLLYGVNSSIIDAACMSDVETVGDTKISTTVTKNGANSLVFDGVGDWLTIADGKEYQFYGDYTIEFWFKANSVAGVQGLINKGFGFSIVISSGNIQFHLSPTNNTAYFMTGVFGTGLIANTWYHAALVKSGTTYSGYLNGVVGFTGTSTSVINAGTSPIRVGATSDNYCFAGYMVDIKISKSAIYTSTFTPPLMETSVKTDVNDIYFNKNLLVIQANGANNSHNKIFTDSSFNNFSLTRTGNVSQGSFTPFNSTSYSVQFNGTTSSIGLPVATGNVLELGLSNFTVEGWFLLSTLTANATLFTLNGNGGGYAALRVNVTSVGSLVLSMSTTGSSWEVGGTFTTVTGPSLAVGNWYHIAVVRNSTSIALYINGIADITKNATISGSLMTTYTINYLGAYTSSSINTFSGSISNFRIVKGSAVYTSDFVVPTAPLTEITGTSLLTCQSNRIIDKSSNVLTLIANGSPRISSSIPYPINIEYSTSVNSGSGYFDGNGDYLTSASATAFGFGSSDFTIECMFYPLVVTSSMVLVDFRSGSASNAPNISIGADGTIRFFANGADRITGSVLIPFQWYHVAAVRISGVTKLYLNGVQTGSSYTDTNNYLSPARAQIGANDNGTPNAYFNGYIANLRVLKDTGLYTNTFTPSAEPLTAISNTSLLLNFTNANIVDITSNTNLETLGNAKVSNAVSKWGGASMYFDGTSGCCVRTSPYIVNSILTTDFTIELWYYRLTGSSGTLFRSNDTSSNIPGIWLHDNAGTLAFRDSTDGASENIVGSGGTLTTGTWHHIVHRRVGPVFSLYLNGVLTATTLNASPLYNPNTQLLSSFAIGGTTSSNVITGYIDDVGVTWGKGKYTVEPTTELIL